MISAAQKESEKRLEQLNKDIQKQMSYQDWESVYKLINLRQDTADEALLKTALEKLINLIIANFQLGFFPITKLEDLFKNSIENNNNPLYKFAMDHLTSQCTSQNINGYLGIYIYDARRKAFKTLKKADLSNDSLTIALNFVKTHFEKNTPTHEIFTWLFNLLCDEFHKNYFKVIKETLFDLAINIKDETRIIDLAELDHLPALFYLAQKHAKERGVFVKSPHVRRAISTYTKYIVESQIQDCKNANNLTIAKDFIYRFASDSQHEYYEYAKILQTVAALSVPINKNSDAFIIDFLNKQPNAKEFEYNYSEGVSYTFNRDREGWIGKVNLKRLDAKAAPSCLYYGDSPFNEPMMLIEKPDSKEYIPIAVFLRSLNKNNLQKTNSVSTNFTAGTQADQKTSMLKNRK